MRTEGLNGALLSVLILTLLVMGTLTLTLAQPSGFDDEFETSTLDSRWTIYDDYGGSAFSLTSMPGYITISTTSPPDRDLYQAINFYSPRIMQPIYGDFTVETKVLATMDTSIQSGGIVAWKDQNNFLRLERAFRHGYDEILFIGTINGVWSMPSGEVSNPGAVLHIENINPTYLRLVRTDNIYSGYYSADGVNWSFVANITMNTDYSLMAGLYNVNRGPPWYSSTAFTVSFDYFRIEPLQLEATVDIKPDTINLKSRARWITAYIELPPSYNVGDIDVGTVMLLVGDGNVPAEPRPTKIGDHDHDGIPDLKVRFERGAVQAFMPSPGEYTLTIRGEVAGVPFEGSKTVSAIIRS